MGVYRRKRVAALLIGILLYPPYNRKESWLDSTQDNLLPGRFRPVESAKATFMESLICNVDPKARLLMMFEGDPPLPSSRNPNQCQSGSPSAPQSGPSPFPSIDDFISSRCSEVSKPQAYKSYSRSQNALSTPLNTVLHM
jgi:hypothetical protein